MKQIFSFRSCYLILAGPLLSSLSVYFILSSLLLFPSDIAVTLSVILFALLLGLSSYLQDDRDESRKKGIDLVQKNDNTDANGFYHNKDDRDQKISVSNLIFIAVYIFSIIIVGTSKPLGITGEVFIAWNHLFTSLTQIMQLVAAILLSFFFPGYALVSLLVKVYPLESLPKLLLSFLFSMLIAGFSVYVAAILIGVPAAYVNPIIIGVDVIVLILFIICNKTKKTLSIDLHSAASFFSQSRSKFRMIITTKNIALFIIIASLFALVVFYTCYLERGVIVGDQSIHHGRALLMNSGTFKDVGTTEVADKNYPPFFSALLAGFFSLSGVPSVNAYVSVNFLNMMAVFAFYYFFTRWVPANQRKAVVLASTLFVLSSGFGWILVLQTSLTNNDQNSQLSSLENLHWASIRSSDIRTPNTFINVGHPTFTSPLIIISLPAGFVLLGLIKEHIGKKGKLRFICIITAITVLGIVSHPEFYLFIIVGSILILSFRLSNGNLTYASIMLAFIICIFIDFLSPQNYYTSTKILNWPLLILCLVFVSILWGLYRTRILSKLSSLKSVSHSFLFTKIVNSSSKNAIRIVIISVLAYLYLFTFIILEVLSIDDIRIQVGTSTQRNIPWYLYPMKFGVVGLLGLTFIVSYLFKRFEKEIFVFGIIAVVALLAGPYYDEHRFSKYIMVGMVGFASILVYKINLFLQGPSNDLRHHTHFTTSSLKPLASGILLGLVVTSAALSVFMLAGYKGLGYKSPQFQEDFYRIDLPSPSEMNLLNFFRADLPYLKTHSIAIQANDIQTKKIFSELEGYSAIPRSRILQNPQSLNASTLEGLYSSLANENIKYIILLKKDVDTGEQFSKPTHFALDNFQRVYEDGMYIVLKVPDLSPRLAEGAVDIGLVYNIRNELPPLSGISNNTNNSNSNSLQYNHKFFSDIDSSSQFIKIENKGNGNGNESKSSENETLTLYGDKKVKTLWSSPIKRQNDVNYVEGKFRLIAENNTRNDLGIKLEDDRNKEEYYVSVDKDSLNLRQKSNLDNITNKQQLLSQNRQVTTEQKGLWHTLKILVLNDTINVYFDDVLKIKEPKSLIAENFNSIYKIGITANKNIVQFKPLKIGYLSESALESYQKNQMKETYYQHYYPLSALALSRLGYGTFVDGDFSVFSKKSVVLTSDPKLELVDDEKRAVEDKEDQDKQVISEQEFHRYLEFVNSGGTLIVMNPGGANNNQNNGNKSEGAFSKFLSVRYGDKFGFNGIMRNEKKSVNPYLQQQVREQNEKKGLVRNEIGPHQQNFINISGVATNIEFSNSSDIDVNSYYVDVNKDNNSNIKTVAPFAIEKKYGEGKIVLVNIAGYFDSVFKSNNKEFITIDDIPKMIDFESDMYYDIIPREKPISAGMRIIGDMKIYNSTGMTIKSPSLLFDSIIGKAPSYNLTVNKITTSPHMPIKTNNSNYNRSLQQQNINENTTKNQSILTNLTIRDLKLYGPYEVSINFTDNLFRVLPMSSYYDYTAVAIPTGFNMLLNLSQGAYAKFTIISCTNNSHCREQPIRISDGVDIYFHKIKADSQSIPSLPIFVKSPEITIMNGTVRFKVESGSNSPVQPSGNLVENGNIEANFDYHETYNLFNKNGIKTNFVTYLKSLDIHGNYTSVDREQVTLRLPGDISELAKEKEIEVPWQRTMMSFTSIIIMIFITLTMIAVNYYIWPKIKIIK